VPSVRLTTTLLSFGSWWSSPSAVTKTSCAAAPSWMRVFRWNGAACGTRMRAPRPPAHFGSLNVIVCTPALERAVWYWTSGSLATARTKSR
jgi:hypothetical protein